MGECPIVGVLGIRLLVDILAHHPIVVIIMWMMAFHHLILPITDGHTAELHTFHSTGNDREIDIEADITRKAVLKHLTCNIFY